MALSCGGFVAVRTISRFLRGTVWFAETVGLLAFALLFGYVTYRVLWGMADDPRVHAGCRRPIDRGADVLASRMA